MVGHGGWNGRRPLADRDSARSRAWSVTQVGAVLAVVVLVWIVAARDGEAAKAMVAVTVGGAFMAGGLFRLALLFASTRATAAVPEMAGPLPRYTILCALRDEADMIPTLVERLSALDYPADRLEGWLVIDADDAATLAAARRARKPAWLGIHVAPNEGPCTKPRALNSALERATGELITVYDAEDAPEPGQLREAAARFAVGHGRLACLQAPLRIKAYDGFLARHFAVEYAALFEVLAPGLARLGLPFALGGTSNHFRTALLREVGGWDAWNVTEDADLGFRLWRRGWRTGMMRTPTWECPPNRLSEWLPQRTRWLKGHMQTFGVHTRRPWTLSPRVAVSLAFSLGGGLAAAAFHGPSLCVVAVAGLYAVQGLELTVIPPGAAAVMGFGMAVSGVCRVIGARRAGVRCGWREIVEAPAYWALSSLAFCHAAWRLAVEPHRWNKTPHRPPVLDEAAADRLSADHASAPEPVA